jgi:DNA-directed RNA polymerase subunit K/omega
MAVESSLSSAVDNLSLDPESVTPARVEFPRASHDGSRAPLDGSMVMPRPARVGKFEFVVLASLRAAQLTRGCLPRVDGLHKHTVMAQLEVSQGKVMQELTAPVVEGA